MTRTDFPKVRAGRWQSAAGWKVEARGPECFAIISPDRRLVAQRDNLSDALDEAARLERGLR